jgi:hypothetical protein
MAAIHKNGNKIYFTKEHEMIRRAIADFMEKKLIPIWINGKTLGQPGTDV